MIGLKRVLPFAAVLLATSFAAQATQATYSFAAVTGVQYGANASITGVFAGDTTVNTVVFPSTGSDYCANFAFAMISNPGTYGLTVTVDSEIITDPIIGTYTSTTLVSCRLNRNP